MNDSKSYSLLKLLSHIYDIYFKVILLSYVPIYRHLSAHASVNG